MYEKPYTFELNESTRTDLDYLKTTYGSFEKVFWDMKDRFDADAEWNLSDFPLKYDFVQRIKPLFANDKWQDEKDTDGNAYAKIEDYINGMKLNTLVEKIGGKAKPAESNDKYGKIIQIKTIDDRNNFPASHTRKEKKVYVLSLTDKTYVFYGNWRVKISDANNQKKFEMKNTNDIIDNLIKSEEMDVETQNESINRIWKKIFGYYEKQINKSISDIPWIQLQTSISDNPYLFIAESDTWNVLRKINVNNYVKDGVLDMATLKKHIEFTKKRTDNLKKTIETLRGRSYSAEEIFGKNNKLIKPDAYKTFFSYFKDNNNRVMIDKNKSYTFYQPTSWSDVHYATIQFDLDESWPFDHKYCKWLTIDTMNDKAINKDGTLNETELKKFLAEKITAIINNPESGYI